MAKKAAKKTLTTKKAPARGARPKAKDGGVKPHDQTREALVKAWFVAFEGWRQARRDYQFALDDLEEYRNEGEQGGEDEEYEDGEIDPAREEELEQDANEKEDAWRDAEAAESEAAAKWIAFSDGITSGYDGGLETTQGVDVDPAKALTFWKRADWQQYDHWADTHFGELRRQAETKKKQKPAVKGGTKTRKS